VTPELATADPASRRANTIFGALAALAAAHETNLVPFWEKFGEHATTELLEFCAREAYVLVGQVLALEDRYPGRCRG
jgi:hypothetical protein